MRHINGWGRKEKMIAGIVCLLLLAFLLYHFVGSGKQATVKIKKGKPLVTVQTVVRGDMMRHIDLSGQTVADADIPLSPKYAGRITAVNVRLGDTVHEGDILLVQDTKDLDISIRQNEAATSAADAEARTTAASYDANYIKARNDLEVETGKYERNQYLFSIGAISQERLDAVKQEYMASKAAFDALENQASGGTAAQVEAKRFTADKSAYATDALRQQRDDMFLRAPRDGVIGYRDAEVGELVTAGKKVLSVVDTHHIYVDCTLGENDAAVLQTGLPVTMTIESLGASYEGHIIYVSPAMDTDSKTYTVRVELDGVDDTSGIKAGLFASCDLDILQKTDTIAVPREAVLARNDRSVVFVVLPDGKVEERTVTTGLINDTQTEILSGLEDGDIVVISNLDRLQTGTAVNTREADS